MSLVNLRAVSDTLNVLMQNWMQNSHAAITGHKTVRRVTWDAFWTMCPIHKGWSQSRKALGVSVRNALHSTHRHVPPLLTLGWGFAALDRQGMKSHRSGHQLQLERRQSAVRGQAQFPDALILLAATVPVPTVVPTALPLLPSCCWTRQRCCLAGLFLLHWRAGAASAPHPHWNRVSGRPWHCHPELLCKCQNYSKAPLGSLQNSQLKKSILKTTAFT